MMEVRSLPYPDIYFRSLLRCLEGGQTSLQCVRQAAWFSDLNTLWQGDQYSVYIDSPQFDAMLDTNNKVHLAVSNHYHTSTAPFVSCMKVSVLLRPGNDTVVQLEGNQLFVQTGGSEEHPDFVLLPANNLGLLVTGGEKVRSGCSISRYLIHLLVIVGHHHQDQLSRQFLHRALQVLAVRRPRQQTAASQQPSDLSPGGRNQPRLPQVRRVEWGED